MDQRLFRLPGATAIKSLQQGDFSNLCGLYSVLNAIQLALWPIQASKEQLRCLHRHGVRHLSRKRKLTSVMAAGMDEHIWIELAHTLVKHTNMTFNGALILQPLLCETGHLSPSARTDRCLRELRKRLTKSQPILCGLGGALDHYTVLSGFSRTTFTLFDSSGFRFVKQANVGADERAGKRHWFYADSVWAVVDDW